MKLLVTDVAGCVNSMMSGQQTQGGHEPKIIAPLAKEHREGRLHHPQFMDGTASAQCLYVCSVQGSATTVVRFRQYFKPQGGLNAAI